MRRHGEGRELLHEGFNRRFQQLRKREKIKCEIGLTFCSGFSICGAIGHFEWRVFFAESEVGAYLQTQFVAGKEFGAGPVKNAGDFTAGGKLKQCRGQGLFGAGLTKFVSVEHGCFSCGPIGKEALVEAAFAAGAVAHQEQGADRNSEVWRCGVDETFAFHFLLGVEIDR